MDLETLKTNGNGFTFAAVFVSDIHLSPALPKTSASFLSFLRGEASKAERLFLLGDIFEYWAGDDDLNAVEHREVIQALQSLSERGTQVFWIAGNRDFLVGQHFANTVGATILDDPYLCEIGNEVGKRKLILSHGDQLCTDDLAYMQFRRMVRQTEWQQQFLAQSLQQRKAIIAAMREQSSAAQKTKQMDIMDVNQAAVEDLLQRFPDADLIHGHTHRHALHKNQTQQRIVLPDWDLESNEGQRGAFLSLDYSGRLRFHYLEYACPVLESAF